MTPRSVQIWFQNRRQRLLKTGSAGPKPEELGEDDSPRDIITKLDQMSSKCAGAPAASMGWMGGSASSSAGSSIDTLDHEQPPPQPQPQQHQNPHQYQYLPPPPQHQHYQPPQQSPPPPPPRQTSQSAHAGVHHPAALESFLKADAIRGPHAYPVSAAQLYGGGTPRLPEGYGPPTSLPVPAISQPHGGYTSGGRGVPPPHPLSMLPQAVATGQVSAGAAAMLVQAMQHQIGARGVPNNFAAEEHARQADRHAARCQMQAAAERATAAMARLPPPGVRLPSPPSHADVAAASSVSAASPAGPPPVSSYVSAVKAAAAEGVDGLLLLSACADVQRIEEQAASPKQGLALASPAAMPPMVAPLQVPC